MINSNNSNNGCQNQRKIKFQIFQTYHDDMPPAHGNERQDQETTATTVRHPHLALQTMPRRQILARICRRDYR
jgi:hypothetical protein